MDRRRILVCRTRLLNGTGQQPVWVRAPSSPLMDFNRKFELFRVWCTSVLMSNLDNKHNIWFRDMYPYKSGEQPRQDIHSDPVTGMNKDMNISRPLIGQTTWSCYSPENIKGRQVHNLQILRNSYQPWITFEQFLSRYE